MLFSVVVLALLASVQGRAVNISNTWVLPEEGFPVFYRYFRDRISWYEADAVCQFHHANLVTVDTTAQYDAVRAYLKELDISSAVWVGLIRSNPDGDFTWTDYRGLSGDGYWSSAPDSRSAPLCAAADPAADYRWEARACGGPTVASFICELPVPQWALGNDGCMIRALPALTILYLPESAAVQLTADCGMAGVKKVQCTGNVKREDLLKELSCAVEEELSSTPNVMSTGSNWPASTDSTFADQDTTNEVTTEEVFTTEHEIDLNQPLVITATSRPHYIYTEDQHKAPVKIDNFKILDNVLMSKNINLGENRNNLQSNYIPTKVEEDNVLTNDQIEKLEYERNMQHKMLHEEIARVGNVDNIFTQPTDHFIPPLVMAKSRISDDMTVLSLAEKHAQQLAEKQFNKYKSDNIDINDAKHDYSNNMASINDEKSLTTSLKLSKMKDIKKVTNKSNIPKKYVNEKHYDVKSKTFKDLESKSTETYKPTQTSVTTESFTKPETTTKIPTSVDDNLGMELTVLLKDAPSTSEETSFEHDVPKLEAIKSNAYVTNTTFNIHNVSTQADNVTVPETEVVENITLKHEVIKITLITENPTTNTTVFEITTKIPVHNEETSSSSKSTEFFKEVHSSESVLTTTHHDTDITTTAFTKAVSSETTTTPGTFSTSATSTVVEEDITTAQPLLTTTEVNKPIKSVTATHSPKIFNNTGDVYETTAVVSSTTLFPITLPTTVEANQNNNGTSNVSNESIEKLDDFNVTDIHDALDRNVTDSGEIDDFQSPLLSGAMEPMHRPPRTRRPQQPNRNKFNPFRILG